MKIILNIFKPSHPDLEVLVIAVLLFGSTLWGLYWLPLRLLEQAGLAGIWAVAFIYTGATVTLALLARQAIPALRHHGRAMLGIGVAAAISGIAFSIGMIEGEVARVLILFYLAPVWSVFLAHRFLHEPLAPITIPALTVALAGALLMLLAGADLRSLALELSDLLGLVAGLAFAATNVQLRATTKLPESLKAMAACFLVPPLAIVGALILDVPLAAAPPRALIGGLVVGIVWMTTMIVAVQYGVTRLTVQRSSVLLLFELVVGAVSAALIAGEALGAWEWIGGLCIIAAGLAVVWQGPAPLVRRQ